MTEPPTPQSAYADYRRLWAEEVAQIVPTAVPFPKRRAGGYRLKAPPNTDDESDPQD
jgi:hypothetical protein